ncbi:MAG TPA: ATP-binding protein [Phycisphaerae bacterium]|nr:ATP-binding protein [Phycisphaerae bacterium]
MNLAPGSPIRMTVLSTPAHLPVVRAAVEKVCELAGVDEQAIGGVVLSVDEAMTNIIRHAYDGHDDQPIEIELSVTDSALRIRLRDFGRSVDPAEIRSRELDDVRPGGLGVHIMQECMDSVSYEPAEGGGTRLTLTKRIAAQEELRP